MWDRARRSLSRGWLQLRLAFTAFCLMDQVRHFSRGDIKVPKPLVDRGLLGECCMKTLGRFAKQSRGIPLDSAVGVQFDEDPPAAADDSDLGLQPEPQSPFAGWSAAVKIGIL